MARARNIKPSLFDNEVLGVADPLLTLLFQSLWCHADREGRLEDRPLRLKAQTFPYRDGVDCDALLSELESLGFIERYAVDGLRLIQILNFRKHQNPHHTEKPSELPPPPSMREITQALALKNGAAPADSLNTDSLNRKTAKPFVPAPDTAELQVWLTAVASAMKVKNVGSLPMLNRWQKECTSGIANDVDLLDFLNVVESQMLETRDKPQFFTPEKCMQIAQLRRANASRSKNGSSMAAAEKKVIADCGLCDEFGEIEVYEGKKFVGRRACDHNNAD